MRRLLEILLVVVLSVAAVTLVGCGEKKQSRRTVQRKEETEAEKAEDAELEKAKAEAKRLLDQANASMQEVQGMGIDTSDLFDAMLEAQSRYENAETVEDYLGETDSSAYWSLVVINGCEAKKQEYLAQRQMRRPIYSPPRDSSVSGTREGEGFSVTLGAYPGVVCAGGNIGLTLTVTNLSGSSREFVFCTSQQFDFFAYNEQGEQVWQGDTGCFPVFTYETIEPGQSVVHEGSWDTEDYGPGSYTLEGEYLDLPDLKPRVEVEITGGGSGPATAEPALEEQVSRTAGG